MKTCTKCKISKELSEFHKDKIFKDGLTSRCKCCKKEYNIANKEKISNQHKIYHEENKQNEDYLSNKRLNTSNWASKNKDKIKEYEIKNKIKIQQYHLKYDKNNIEAKRIRYSKLYNSNKNFKLLEILRKRFYSALKGTSKSKRTIEILGCTMDEFKQYIEQQFKPEMNWSNHGTIWEIDHTIQCIMFDLTDPKQQEQCFHYSNMRPLFKTTDIAKSFGYTNEIGNRNRDRNKLNIQKI